MDRAPRVARDDSIRRNVVHRQPPCRLICVGMRVPDCATPVAAEHHSPTKSPAMPGLFVAPYELWIRRPRK